MFVKLILCAAALCSSAGLSAPASAREDLKANVSVLIKKDGFGRELAYLKNLNGKAVVVIVTETYSDQPDKPVERRHRVDALSDNTFIGGLKGPTGTVTYVIKSVVQP